MNKFLILLLTLSTSVSFAQKKTKPAPEQKPAAATPAPAYAPRAESRPTFSREYGLAGCGLGSVVMGKRGGQISASTTNGTAGNQTFAITSGTSNCLDGASSQVASRMDQFINVNRSQFQGDVARGNGETIAALENFMGCKAPVGSALKANYSEIFSEDAAANEVTDSVITVIMQNPELAKNCTNLG